MCAAAPPVEFSGWSGGPLTMTRETFPPLTRTTSTLSVVQRRAPTTSVRAPPQGVSPERMAGPPWGPAQPPVSMTSQGSQTAGTSSYAATAIKSQRQVIRHETPQEPPPMDDATTRRVALISSQQEMLASILPATPYQQQIFAPTPVSIPTLGRGNNIRQSAATCLPIPGKLGVQAGHSMPGAGRGRGILSYLTPTTTSTPAPPPGQRPEMEEASPMEHKRPGSSPTEYERPDPSSEGDRPTSSRKQGYRPKEPSLCRGEGWRKDTQCIYAYHLSMTSPKITSEEADKIIDPVLELMEENQVRWYYPKENRPVQFGRLLNDFFEEVQGYPPPGAGYVRLLD